MSTSCPRRPLLLVVAAFVACSSLAIAPCESDEDKIKDVVDEAIGSNDPDICTDLVTDNFIEALYDGSKEECEQDAESEEPDDPTGAEIANLEIDDDKATAELTLEGGGQAGTVIDAGFVKEDGDWKLDTFDIPITGQTSENIEAAITEELSAEFGPEVANCIVEGISADLQQYDAAEISAGNVPPELQTKIEQVAQGCVGG